MAQAFDPETLRQRLGPADELQIRLLLNIPPDRRVRTMLNTQDAVVRNWFGRLRRARPELSDLELCQSVFKSLYQNG